MKRLMAVVLVLSLCLFALSVTSPLVFGGAVGQTVNGDTNGDGERDISDAVHLLQWLFSGGEPPVEIVCPVGQGDRVAELLTQLATAEAGLAAANAEIAVQAEQIAVLENGWPVGLLPSFAIDCPAPVARSFARQGSSISDAECQELYHGVGMDGLYQAVDSASVPGGCAGEGSRFETVLRYISLLFQDPFYGPEAKRWLSLCDLECPE